MKKPTPRLNHEFFKASEFTLSAIDDIWKENPLFPFECLPWDSAEMLEWCRAFEGDVYYQTVEKEGVFYPVNGVEDQEAWWQELVSLVHTEAVFFDLKGNLIVNWSSDVFIISCSDAMAASFFGSKLIEAFDNSESMFTKNSVGDEIADHILDVCIKHNQLLEIRP